MNYQLLLEQIAEYVRYYYQQHNTSALIYHNQEHTDDVVRNTIFVADHYQLNDADFFAVTAAAWFHDLGYMVSPQKHEEHSATIAREFLGSHDATPEAMDAVEKCILATRMPQQPNTLIEEIICDADLYHLGTDEFKKKDKLLRKEMKDLCGLDISKSDWRKHTIGFLMGHHYHTDYCQLLLNKGKQKNIEELEAKLTKDDAKVEEKEKSLSAILKPEDKTLHVAEGSTIVEEKAEPVKKKDRPDKGIETMFRISSGNHQRLSDMADNKAHIMITVNSIILSAIISLLLRRLTEYHYLLIPTCILLSISLLAMTFSILSTRPSIPEGTFTRGDVDDRRVNLLFFGNFYRMSLTEYTYGMEKMMEDREFLYGSLIRDVYAQGVVLGKKYRLLRIAYNIFMFGLIAAVLAFILAALYNQQTEVVK